jgi:integrase
VATIRLNEQTLPKLPLPSGIAAQAYYWDAEQRGFGVVVGRSGQRTFVARGRVNGELRKVTLGIAGRPRDADGLVWTVKLARIAARKVLGAFADGKAPARSRRGGRWSGVSGPTVGDAFELHLSRMRADDARARSLETVETERDKYLAAWLKRPLRTIERADCREMHEELTKNHGPYLANRVMRHLRAAWNTALREHELPASPTIAVHWNKEHRRQEPIAWEKLPAWRGTVLTLEKRGADERVPGIRGDYNMVILLTGLRRMDAATIRWDHLNLTDEPQDARVWNATRDRWDTVELPPYTLLRPNPKGGRDRAFSIPLSSECVRILEERQRENRDAFTKGDGGWVFPSHAIKEKECALCAELGLPDGHEPGAVIHLVEAKQQKWDPKKKTKTTILVSPHRLRDTYTSALAALKDPPLSPYVIDVLTNHRPPKGSVTAGYIDLSAEDLREAQERVSKFLLDKMTPDPEKRRTKARRAA